MCLPCLTVRGWGCGETSIAGREEGDSIKVSIEGAAGGSEGQMGQKGRAGVRA